MIQVALSVIRFGENLSDDLRDSVDFYVHFLVGQDSPQVRTIRAFLMSY